MGTKESKQSMTLVPFLKKLKPNHQVHDHLSAVQSEFVKGKFGSATKCMVILQNPETGKVHYEPCGLHLIEAIGILEVAKNDIIKGSN